MWRYEPLDTRKYPVGSGPFRARGLAYAHVLAYVDARLPGGRRALLDRLGPADPFASFFDQIFIASGEYDLSPLVRLFAVAASMKGVDVGAFIRRRSARSGETDTKGVWKPALHGRTPEEVAPRLSFAFARYYPPCTGAALRTEPGLFEGELRGLPGCMNGVYVDSTIGFYEGALAGVGARDVRADFDPPVGDGVFAGVALERIHFTVRWAR